MGYIYIQSESACWTVGFYDPGGEWQSESDHSTPEKAAERVAYLNGGGPPLELRETVKQLYGWIANLEQSVIELRLAVFTASPDPMLAAVLAVVDELRRANDRNDRLEGWYLNRQEASADAEAVDPFMPPDGFWRWMPDAKCVAVDRSGKMFWYEDAYIGEAGWLPKTDVLGGLGYRDLGDTDWRTTKRMRPSHL